MTSVAKSSYILPRLHLYLGLFILRYLLHPTESLAHYGGRTLSMATFSASGSTPDSVTSFGRSLDNIGFWGASSINPNDMRNNCVSVAVARMLDFETVEDLWKAVFGRNLPDQPLDKSQVFDLLTKAKMSFQYAEFQSTPGGLTAFQSFQSVSDALFRDVVSEYLERWVDVKDYVHMLVCYIRNDSFGHCVNGYYHPNGRYAGPKWTCNDVPTPGIVNLEDNQHKQQYHFVQQDVMSAKHILILYEAEAGSKAWRDGKHLLIGGTGS